jgi:hypothetical protein
MKGGRNEALIFAFLFIKKKEKGKEKSERKRDKPFQSLQPWKG